MSIIPVIIATILGFMISQMSALRVIKARKRFKCL